MSKPDSRSEARAWKEILRPYQGPHLGSSLFQLLSTAALYGTLWYAMLRSLEVSYALTLLLALPVAGLQIRLFIIQHDCGHGSYFRSRPVADLVGFLIGIVTLVPYGYWRKTHAIHHATSGNLDERDFGDIRTLTVREYRGLSRLGRLGYRLYRHPFTLFVVGPIYQFVLKHRLPLDLPRTWKREWASILWTNLGIAATVLGLTAAVGLERFLLVQAPLIVLSGTIGIWLFYVQHQFEDAYWQEGEEWDVHRAGIEGSSFYDLPAALHWLTGNIGFHHVHHLNSRIPNYRLRRCHDENVELHGATRLGLRESFGCVRLKLWDEESRRLVGFRALREITCSESRVRSPRSAAA